MNEQEVRALVREAIERHLGRPGSRATKVAPYRAPGATEVAPDRDPYATEVAPDREDIGMEAVGRADIGRGPQDIDTAAYGVGRARLQSSYEHPSHIILQVLPGSEIDDGMCVIEPAVRCNHCGFCQSYGH